MYLPTKTVKSTRICYLPQDILPRMRQLGKNKHGRISAEKYPSTMVKDYKEHCLMNNIPYCSFTNLRHT